MTEIDFSPSILKNYFTLKSVQACRACKRYGSGQCPPSIPSIDYYKELLPSYKNGIIVFKRFEIKGDWKEQGRSSSLEIHNYLLEKRTQLLNEGYWYSIILGAGSCKLCPNCVTPCRQPDKAIVPIEGCGLDVVRLMEEFDVYLGFPVEKQEFFFRIGMVLYE
jgi:predicted metal-binding protein